MTKAEAYAKTADAVNNPPTFAPDRFWRTRVDGHGNLYFNQQYLVINKDHIPAFIEWLNNTFIYPIDTSL